MQMGRQKMHLKCAVCVLLMQLTAIHAARILAVFPIFIKSHSIFTNTIVKELAARGHDVTIITPFEEKDPLPNYRQIITDKRSCWSEEHSESESEYFIKNSPPPFIFQEFTRWSSLQWFTEASFNSSSMKEFIQNDNSQYDLVLTELFLQESFLMFGHKYKAPVIMLSTFGGGHFINQQMGNPMMLSSVPFEFIDFFGPMSLRQRLKNILYTIVDLTGRKFYHLPSQQSLAELHFGHLPKPLPKLTDLERNVSLILVNTHFSIDTVRPNIPGIIEVGGVHIKPPKELTGELKKFCDEAKDGVVFFSLGSIMDISSMPKKRINEFVNAFSKLKQRVLWKWDGDNPPSVSKNVLISKWFPQAEILNHPNTKIFITHGGLLGFQEALHYGVPIIGMPFYGDQSLNVDKAFKKGVGLKLLFKDATEAKIIETIEKIIQDPNYKRRARDVSKRFRDQPLNAMETAVFWIEYVIRNEGANHMRSPILDLSWYEYLLIDVVLLLITGSVVIGLILYFATVVLCKLLLYRKPYKQKPKNKKQ